MLPDTGAPGEELFNGAGFACSEFLIALLRLQRGSSDRGSRVRLQLAGAELRNDHDHAVGGFHFKLLPALKTRAAQGGWGTTTGDLFLSATVIVVMHLLGRFAF